MRNAIRVTHTGSSSEQQVGGLLVIIGTNHEERPNAAVNTNCGATATCGGTLPRAQRLMLRSRRQELCLRLKIKNCDIQVVFNLVYTLGAEMHRPLYVPTRLRRVPNVLIR